MLTATEAIDTSTPTDSRGRMRIFVASFSSGVFALLSACTTPATPAPATSASSSKTCAAAALAAAPSDVWATVDGQPVTVQDLGAELKKAEDKALQEYCDGIYAQRNQALDGYIAEKLLKKEAEKQGKSPDEFLKSEVEKRAPSPTELELQAFYDEKKKEMDGIPPFEAVKDQIAQLMRREKQQAAVEGVLTELHKGVTIERKMPDVRSPPRNVDIAKHTSTRGSKDGKVVVVEFADFQCPYCSNAAAALHEMQKKFGDRVTFAYRHFPLRSIHPDAQRAAEFSQCAREQGKFWELHDKLYQTQQDLAEPSLRNSAKSVGIDEAKLDACLSSGRAIAEVQEDVNKGEELNVAGTPTIFINGRLHVGAVTAQALESAIEAAF